MNRPRIQIYFPALVALVTLALYLPSLRYDFVNIDDNIGIYLNPHIRSLNFSFIRWAFTDVSLIYWQPIGWIAYALHYAVWGLDPAGYHLTNSILHAVNTFIVVFLVIRLVEYTKGISLNPGLPVAPDEQRTILTAGCVTGMLFGMHPVQAEAVAHASSMPLLLCTLFFLLSIRAYQSYLLAVEMKTVRRESASFLLNRQYLAAFILFMLALSSKPAAVILPGVLILLDWYPFHRIRSLKSLLASCAEKIPFLVLGLIVTILTYRNEMIQAALLDQEETPPAARVLVAFKALVMYLWHIIAPFDLRPMYSYPMNISFMSLEFSIAIALVCGITMICMLLAKKQPLLLTVWGYFIVTLLPVLFVRLWDVYLADRYLYLPGLGPFFLAGLAAVWFWNKIGHLQRGILARRIALVMALLLCMSIAYLTLRQISIWNTSITLWDHVIHKEPNGKLVAYNLRGNAFRDSGQFDRALEDYNTAVALFPSYAKTYYNRGYFFRKIGRLDLALEDFRQAIRLDPSPAVAYTNRGSVYGESGQIANALADFNAAIALDPAYADAYTGRGLALEQSGQLERALDDYNKAIILKPNSVEAYLNRGVVFERMGLLDQAIQDYDRAIELKADDHLAYGNRGGAYRKRGMFDKAILDFTQALAWRPDFIQAYLERGDCYWEKGDRTRAMQDYQKACDLGSKAGCDEIRSRSAK